MDPDVQSHFVFTVDDFNAILFLLISDDDAGLVLDDWL